MKNAISTTEIFKYVLLFTFLFAAFLTLAITYNRVYKLKNETMSILEKYEGVSKKSIKIINRYLENSAYNTLGKCDEGDYGVSDLNNEIIEKATNDKQYYYCVTYNCKNHSCIVNSGAKIYYNITLFYKFNLPIIGDLVTFKVTGETKGIKLYSDIQKLN